MLVFWAMSGTVFGVLDFDGDGLSDIWEQVYGAHDLAPDVDTDGDGVSNIEESLAGSDPFDPSSYFALNGYEFVDGRLDLDLQLVGGQRYAIETSFSLGVNEEWRPAKRFLIGGSGRFVFECPVNPGSEPKLFMRARLLGDEDGDGLSSWEEMMLGLDDRDLDSSNGAGSPDLGWLVDRLLSEIEVDLVDGTTLAGETRTEESVSRFLNQTSYGPRYEEVVSLHNSGETFGEWIDRQIALPPTRAMDSMLEEEELGAARDLFLFRRGWWRSAVEAPDQLRQRVAFALSEILVVSGQGSDIVRGDPDASGSYYDLLIEGAFGNYADLLEDVTYSVAMGSYLGHLRNFKADPERSIFPDENYAREIMQLFSIGLWELNIDGSLKLDYEERPIPTYTNFHVTELAKVMTGFNWGGTTGYLRYNPESELPMSIWREVHDPGEKFLVNGGYLPPGLAPEVDVRLAVENLAYHPNTGPFIGKQLIQRLITSNPSPAYVARVAQAYRDNGAGEVGDLGAVIRAIFLDPEARLESSSGRENFGKMRETFVTYVHLVRAFNSENHLGSYPILTTDGMVDFGQIPLNSPTVFNFFRPDHQPAGPLQDKGLVAPEFEILTPVRLVSWDNVLKRGIEFGIDPARMRLPEYVLHHDYSQELILVESDLDILIDRLDLVFTYGTLKEETKEIIRTAMESMDSSSAESRLHLIIYLVMTSPEYAILR